VDDAADAYILKKAIHDWNDERAVRILRNCRDAMKPHGRVLVAETIILHGNEPNTIELVEYACRHWGRRAYRSRICSFVYCGGAAP